MANLSQLLPITNNLVTQTDLTTSLASKVTGAAATSSVGGDLKLYEATANGTNYVSFKAPNTLAGNVTWSLPAADGSSGQALVTNGSGALSWAAASQWTTSGSDIYYNTGNVGLGVTPSAWSAAGAKNFEFGAVGNAVGGALVDVWLTNNCYYSSGAWRYGATNTASRYEQYSGAHTWYTAPSGTAGNAISFTQAMTLTSGGYLLVGTTSATGDARLVVNNPDNVSGDLGFVTTLGSNCSNTSSYHYVAATGGADKFYLYGNGNVVNTNGSYGTLSDVKLKENIVDATPKLGDVMRLQVRNFNLKTEPSHKQIGFVAQEFEQVFPAMVDESPDRDKEGNQLETTTKHIKTSVLVPILVKAIQELKAELDTVKAELQNLKGN